MLPVPEFIDRNRPKTVVFNFRENWLINSGTACIYICEVYTAESLRLLKCGKHCGLCVDAAAGLLMCKNQFPQSDHELNLNFVELPRYSNLGSTLPQFQN